MPAGLRVTTVAFALVLLAAGAAATETPVVLFDRENLRGERRDLPIGSHAALDFDDRAASLRVEAGFTVTAYELPDFGGRALRVRGARALRHLPSQQVRDEVWAWRGRISSAVVCASSDAACVRPLLFEQPHAKGPAHTAADGAAERGGAFGSALVPARWTVEVWDQPGFRGSRTVLEGPGEFLDVPFRSYRARCEAR